MVYKRALELALAYQKWVLGTTIALFVVALVIFFHLGRSFLPPFNEGSFTINVSSLPEFPWTSRTRSDAVRKRCCCKVTRDKDCGLGRPVVRNWMSMPWRECFEIEAPFELQDRSRDEVMNDVRKKLSTISGANIEIGQPISIVSTLCFPVRRRISLSNCLVRT